MKPSNNRSPSTTGNSNRIIRLLRPIPNSNSSSKCSARSTKPRSGTVSCSCKPKPRRTRTPPSWTTTPNWKPTPKTSSLRAKSNTEANSPAATSKCSSGSLSPSHRETKGSCWSGLRIRIGSWMRSRRSLVVRRRRRSNSRNCQSNSRRNHRSCRLTLMSSRVRWRSWIRLYARGRWRSRVSRRGISPSLLRTPKSHWRPRRLWKHKMAHKRKWIKNRKSNQKSYNSGLSWLRRIHKSHNLKVNWSNIKSTKHNAQFCKTMLRHWSW